MERLAVDRFAVERFGFEALVLVVRLRVVVVDLRVPDDDGLLDRAWRAALARPAAERSTLPAACSAEAAPRRAVPATEAPALVTASSQS